MTDQLDLLDERIARDSYGRPLVIPPGGGKPRAYTRCTKYIDCLADRYKLERWGERMVATGLAARPDLMVSVAAHLDDRDQLDHLCKQAKEAAKSSAAATTGTAVHRGCESLDRGKEVRLPPPYDGDLAAYTEATKSFRHQAIEQFLVLDELKIGGTPDRISRYQNENFIVDIKTGKTIHFGVLDIAMQLAIYAHSDFYDIATGQRTPLPDVNQDKAIVVHLPAGKNTAELIWIDIAAGWEAVQTATAVRGWRRRKNLATSFGGHMTDDALRQEFSVPFDLSNAIATAGDVDALTALWNRHQTDWKPEHTELAKARKQLILTGEFA